MHRTQVLLEEQQYRLLKAEAERTGASIGELVRRAVEQAYGQGRQEALRAALRASRGAWADRDDIGDGAEYVERIRPGFAKRLKKLGLE
jgi:hypothetical protein